ncbi:hypothetical protein KGF54_004088 [Candida jiufengensis]|uniref:uncharacterized protein n=1 Tax=Candida jiufengensis TaxID=497108 RepID=UPI002224AD63|nr:uncharacterized protein KGF54_004088 [Candida jiufengensis]KAI5951014.1 hypothetical protein KGF54_004088 [Candida jiufengensis]
MSISTAIQPPSLSSTTIKTNQGASSSIISSPKSTTKLNSISLPLRSLTISNPKTEEDNFINKLKSNIILITKFSFNSETSNELSIKKGDILKLLDVPSNGWLLVKFIDKLQPPGLIPALYVDIAVNDPINPITLTWLHSINNASSNIIKDHKFLNLQFNKIESKFQTINNKPYPILVSISNFALYNQRYWYRLDVELSNKTKIYLCRYYQDFYNLHINLLDLISKIPNEDKEEDEIDLKLPKLPEPLPTRSKKDVNENNILEDDINLLLKRCNDLNIYINKLILNKYFQTSNELNDWLDLEYNELPGFLEVEQLENDEINQKILPGSIDVVKEFNEKKFKEKEEFEKLQKEKEQENQEEDLEDDDENDEEEEEEKEDLPSRTKSKNIYNNYQQASSAFRQTSIKRTQSKSKSKSISPTSSTPNNSFNISNSSITLVKDQDVGTPNTSMDSNTNSNSPTIIRKKSQHFHPKQPQNYPPLPQNHKLPSSFSTPPIPHSNQFTGNSPHQQHQQQVTPTKSSSSHQPPPHHFHNHQQQYSPNYVNFPHAPKTPTTKPGFSPRNQMINSPQISQFPPNYYYNQQQNQQQNIKMSPLSINTKIFPISGYPNPSQSPQQLQQQQSPTTTKKHPLQNHQILRCKVLNLKNEMLYISIPKYQILSIKNFKSIIFKKLNIGDNQSLFINLPNFKNFENLDHCKFNFDEFLRFNNEVNLKIG